MALDAASEDGKSTPGRAWRVPLAAKLAAALVGLVVLVLLVNGAVNTWLNYNQAKDAALEVQQEKARSAAVRVGEFLADIEMQLGLTTGAEWRFAKPDQQRYDFIRLLRQVPAITELSYLDGQGKEQLKVSRLEPDSVGSGKDFSTDPRFTQAVAEKIWFGPVEFRRGSEPYMTIALAHVGKNSGVTVADVNLKLIWDVISAIRVGDKGYAFVVDGKGRLIAHPDLSLVLRDTDFSQLPQVRQALDANARAEPGTAATPGPSVGAAEIATAFDGAEVLTAYAVAPRTHWIVFVQQPLSEALAAVYTSLVQTLALLGLGLLLALTAGGLLARRMVVPIRRLQQGAEKLGAGDLTQRLDIHTGDEIETLADRFNQMAGRIQESYETLEAKVEARTRDLNESLQQQTATAEVLKVISGSAFDLQPVFDALVSSAVELCNARSGLICIRDGEVFRYRGSAGAGQTESLMTYLEHHPATPGRGTIAGRVMLSGHIEAIPDRLDDAEFAVPLSSLGEEARALLGVPLLRNDAVEGVLIVSRLEPGHFAARQIEVLQTFAAQAVIAIENARLFEEVQA
ncbi:MAG: cache domain-containing protein, partial [Roseiarcus sp.]|uniref:cache domain-containing protein n=1 Tax=Roseiarcus sp. TaxID=1969460 RepID=UPI003C589C6C